MHHLDDIDEVEPRHYQAAWKKRGGGELRTALLKYGWLAGKRG